jgi:hypothetical protein
VNALVKQAALHGPPVLGPQSLQVNQRALPFAELQVL